MEDESAAPRGRRTLALDGEHPAPLEAGGHISGPTHEEPGQGREGRLVADAEHDLVGGQTRQMGDKARHRGPLAEGLDDLRRVRTRVHGGHDVSGLDGAAERAREESVDDHAAPVKRRHHSPMLASSPVGERSITVVGPPVTIGMAGIGVAHQEQSHHP